MMWRFVFSWAERRGAKAGFYGAKIILYARPCKSSDELVGGFRRIVASKYRFTDGDDEFQEGKMNACSREEH